MHKLIINSKYFHKILLLNYVILLLLLLWQSLNSEIYVVDKLEKHYKSSYPWFLLYKPLESLNLHFASLIAFKSLTYIHGEGHSSVC